MTEKSEDSDEVTESEPTPPKRAALPQRSILLIGIVATFCTVGTLNSVGSQFAANIAMERRLSLAATSLVCIVGLVTCWLTWNAGGFRQIRTLSLFQFFDPAKRRVMLVLHGLGLAIRAFGLLFGALAILGVATEQPQPILGQLSIGCLIVGAIIVSLTKGRDITVSARLESLKPTLQEIGRKSEEARTGLLRANETIDEIDREIQRKYRSLAKRLDLNDQLTQNLRADPEMIRAFASLQREEQRSNTRRQWLGVAVGAVLGLAVAYFANLTTDLLSDLLQLLFG